MEIDMYYIQYSDGQPWTVVEGQCSDCESKANSFGLASVDEIRSSLLKDGFKIIGTRDR